jgi:hypothetical protein
MGVPSGEIVERPLLPRACGCVQEFQVYKVDRYRAQRQAKFQATRCPACAAKHAEEQRRAEVPKKEAFGQLPPGTLISLARRPDGAWAGSLAAEGVTVEADADGPQALTVALARRWLAAHRAHGGVA